MTPINNNQNNINSLEGLEQEFKDFWSEEYGCAACDYSECRDRYEDNILAFLMPKIQSLITTHEQQAVERFVKWFNDEGYRWVTRVDEQGCHSSFVNEHAIKQFLEENPST